MMTPSAQWPRGACFILGPIVTTIILHSIGCAIVVGGKGGWSQGNPTRRWRNISIGVIVLKLLFLIAGDDDDLVIVEWTSCCELFDTSQFLSSSFKSRLTTRNP
jgi:hypothetical protein